MPVEIGNIIHYRLTQGDAERTNQRRVDASLNNEKMRDQRPGFQAHIGNAVRFGQVFPAIVTRPVMDGFIGCQVFLDGNDTLWIPRTEEGTEPGQWQWKALDE